MGRLSDSSRCGCYMDTISPFAVNAAIILTVTREGRTFKTKAKVVYSLNGMGMGVMFTTMEPDQACVVDARLAELGGLLHLEPDPIDRKSTRLNSSHSQISYAVFCLKKKKNITGHNRQDVRPRPTDRARAQ